MEDHFAVNVTRDRGAVETVDAQVSSLVRPDQPYDGELRCYTLAVADFACRFANTLCLKWTKVKGFHKRVGASVDRYAQCKQGQWYIVVQNQRHADASALLCPQAERDAPTESSRQQERGSNPPPSAAGGAQQYPQQNPYSIGRSDMEPDFGPAFGGRVPPGFGAPSSGGGMVVGPDHPMFGMRGRDPLHGGDDDQCMLGCGSSGSC